MSGKGQKALILFGTGRSGTTILMEALFRHPDLAYLSNWQEKKPASLALNYVRFLFDNSGYRLFGKKSQLNKVSLFNRVIFKPAEAYPVWDYLTLPEHDFSHSFLYKEPASEGVRKKILAYISKVMEKQQRPRFAMKVTGPSRLHFLNSVFQDAQYIYLKRDFMATLSSFMKVGFWNDSNGGKLWWTGPYTPEELEQAKEWADDPVLLTALQLRKIIAIAEEEMANLSLDVYSINYRKFVEAPSLVLKDMLNWAGLSEDVACFGYLEENQIVNRNKSAEAYFDPATLKRLADNFKLEI